MRISEHMFGVRRGRVKAACGTTAYQVALALLLLTGCLADPQRTQMGQLLERLQQASAQFNEQPPQISAACDTVGDVENRLWGEPGLVDVKPAWSSLRNAADALLSACGQSRMLQQPYEPSPSMDLARQRWERGLSSQLQAACGYLSEAARALGRNATSPGCGTS